MLCLVISISASASDLFQLPNPLLQELPLWFLLGQRQSFSEIRSGHAEFVDFDSCHLENSDAVVLKYSPLLLLFGFFQPLGHLFVICSVTRPALRSTIPAVVFDGHINAAVDEELHRRIVSVP